MPSTVSPMHLDNRRYLLAAGGAVAVVVLLIVASVLLGGGEDHDGASPPGTTSHDGSDGGPSPGPTTPPDTAPPTTMELVAPDRLWLRFDGAPAVEFDSAALVDQVEATNNLALDGLYSTSELSIDQEDGDSFLRQRYVPSDQGSARVEFTVPVEPADEMWLSYRVYFEPGWEWVRGGKLPGLAGGTKPTGGSGADGADGFSARLMWREDGRLVVYAYHPDRPNTYGEDFELRGTVPVGQWLTITQRVQMNSAPDRYDGAVEVWIDGRKRLSRTDLRWRIDGDFSVDTLAYSSFYGGNDPSWAPDDTTFARFDEFRVATDPRGVEWAPEGSSAS